MLPEEVESELKSLGRIPPINFDFAYVSKLTKNLQRVAAFWEYARESTALRAISEDLQKLAPKKLARALSHPVLSSDELLLLSQLCFPGYDFENLLSHDLLPKSFRSPQIGEFASSVIMSFSLEEFCRLGARLQGLGKNWTVRVFAIPWEHSDQKLGDMFRKGLKGIRSTDHPQRKRPGRGGESSGSPIDMLNQLTAFRLQRDGLGFSAMRDFLGRRQYQSERGWKDAFRSAAERIGNMGSRPFFAKHQPKPTPEINWDGIWFIGQTRSD